jgi:uncharacterized protein (UPF0262 family)
MPTAKHLFLSRSLDAPTINNNTSSPIVPPIAAPIAAGIYPNSIVWISLAGVLGFVWLCVFIITFCCWRRNNGKPYMGFDNNPLDQNGWHVVTIQIRARTWGNIKFWIEGSEEVFKTALLGTITLTTAQDILTSIIALLMVATFYSLYADIRDSNECDDVQRQHLAMGDTSDYFEALNKVTTIQLVKQLLIMAVLLGGLGAIWITALNQGLFPALIGNLPSGGYPGLPLAMVITVASCIFLLYLLFNFSIILCLDNARLWYHVVMPRAALQTRDYIFTACSCWEQAASLRLGEIISLALELSDEEFEKFNEDMMKHLRVRFERDGRLDVDWGTVSRCCARSLSRYAKKDIKIQDQMEQGFYEPVKTAVAKFSVSLDAAEKKFYFYVKSLTTKKMKNVESSIASNKQIRRAWKKEIESCVTNYNGAVHQACRALADTPGILLKSLYDQLCDAAEQANILDLGTLLQESLSEIEAFWSEFESDLGDQRDADVRAFVERDFLQRFHALLTSHISLMKAQTHRTNSRLRGDVGRAALMTSP